MPIRKPLNYGIVGGKLTIWPTPERGHGGLPIETDLNEAISNADRQNSLINQLRYVVQVEDKGYVVCSYSDIGMYFGDPMEDAIVYRNEIVRTDDRKWPGEK